MSKMEIGTPLQVMVILILIFNLRILFVSYGKVCTIHTLKLDECCYVSPPRLHPNKKTIIKHNKYIVAISLLYY